MGTDLKLPYKKSCNGQRCFSFREAKMQNDLPEKAKQPSSLFCFKNTFSSFSSFLLIFITVVTHLQLHFCTWFVSKLVY